MFIVSFYFRAGSIIADYTVEFANNVNNATQTQVNETIIAETINNHLVNQSHTWGANDTHGNASSALLLASVSIPVRVKGE